MLYEMGEMSFRLNGASDFYVKTENEDLQLLFARTSNSKFSRCRFVHYVKEIYLSACSTGMHYYFSLFDQSHWFVGLSLPSFAKLFISTITSAEFVAMSSSQHSFPALYSPKRSNYIEVQWSQNSMWKSSCHKEMKSLLQGPKPMRNLKINICTIAIILRVKGTYISWAPFLNFVLTPITFWQ